MTSAVVWSRFCHCGVFWQPRSPSRCRHLSALRIVQSPEVGRLLIPLGPSPSHRTTILYSPLDPPLGPLSPSRHHKSGPSRILAWSLNPFPEALGHCVLFLPIPAMLDVVFILPTTPAAYHLRLLLQCSLLAH